MAAPSSRPTQPTVIPPDDEIADAIAFFLSPAACYVTGQVLTGDGELTLNRSVGHKEP